MRATAVPPALLDDREAAAYLSISRTTFRDVVARDLPRVRIGRCVRFRRADLDEWIAVQAARETAALAMSETAAPARGLQLTMSPRALEIAAEIRAKRKRKP